jgi:hypothetical protein
MVGRPKIYNSVDDILPVLQEWENSVANGSRPTITGLCLTLGFSDKSTLYDYRDRSEFSHPIKTALLIVENGYENALRENNAAGSIFALKNMGWKDKTEVESNNTHNVVWQEERTYEADSKADEGS